MQVSSKARRPGFDGHPCAREPRRAFKSHPDRANHFGHYSPDDRIAAANPVNG